jgi:hypothetical protein
MKLKSKLMRLAVVVGSSSLFWAGCASERIFYGDSSSEVRPVNLLEQRADTYRAQRTGLDDYSRRDTLIAQPSGIAIEEAAGAKRF